jgi:hypothetical protein
MSSASETRKQNDYYPTPPIATNALLGFFGNRVPNRVWEPAAGRGWISKVVQESGREVISTDLYSYDNCLVDIQTGVDYITQSPLAPAVITNPPYKNGLAEAFARKSIAESTFTALFCRLTFMESAKRLDLFRDNAPYVLVFSHRINCDETKFGSLRGEIGGMVAYAWFVWGEGIEKNRIDWINPKEYWYGT